MPSKNSTDCGRIGGAKYAADERSWHVEAHAPVEERIDFAAGSKPSHPTRVKDRSHGCDNPHVHTSCRLTMVPGSGRGGLEIESWQCRLEQFEALPAYLGRQSAQQRHEAHGAMFVDKCRRFREQFLG